jgi:hypothetical protein
MDEIETLLNNLGEEQMKDILAEAARMHSDVLEAIKDAGNYPFSTSHPVLKAAKRNLFSFNLKIHYPSSKFKLLAIILTPYDWTQMNYAH